MLTKSIFYTIVYITTSLYTVSGSRSFTIDYDNNCFLKDGKPFRYVSGSMHYFRVPSSLWEDRMLKMKAAGLNALQTYIEWNSHEPEPGTYIFEDNYDIVNYIQTAGKVGLLVILRPGPFIDAEREMGGLPYWLLKVKPDMQLRTSDADYLYYVDRWFNILFPKLKPLLYSNGGPVISIQIENEYGSYSACDFKYTNHLRDLYLQHFNDSVIFFTTDGSSSSDLVCGRINGVFATIDFGSDLVSGSRSFTIDYDNNCFLKDGKPFRYVSGSMHYFRVPSSLWEDRMLKMKAAGLNALQTYIEWNSHEPEPGTYIFEDNYDIVNYIQTAGKVGLLVILRPGPFIDAEREMGGLPYWLLKVKPDMQLRTSDADYLYYVDRWFNILFPKLKPLLYSNGGPVISIQIENEYGSYSACDFKYTNHLRDLYLQHFNDSVIFFTTDGSSSSDLVCGRINGVFATIDFGSAICFMEVHHLVFLMYSTLWNVLKVNDFFISKYPISFEEMSHGYGFAVYTTMVSFLTTDPVMLYVPGLRDRGYVYVDQTLQGILSRGENIYSLPIVVRPNQNITILVENQGRVCFGSGINDTKGIIQNVTLGSTILTDWTIYPVSLKPENLIKYLISNAEDTDIPCTDCTPGFYMSLFKLPNKPGYPYDTFLKLNGWHKGVAFLNEHNLGRYWPIIGPQVTLYVPSVFFESNNEWNSIVLFELEHAPCDVSSTCIISLVKDPILNGTTPN
ncbi:beta-galactosidase-like [Centruroides sculpturatus]|uniref:beta-galactosidase-like n=1 Tax=Centruroides sculpturatus TaxID=218467 RepID=UPI000C6E5A0E|nr:beta-galactosidase-like [Centruroides sculpturatus]